MKILVLTSLYPNKESLYYGIFVHQQVRALQELGVECHVLLVHKWYPPLGLHKYHPQWKEGYNFKNNFFEELEGVKIYSVPMFQRRPSRIFNETYYDVASRSIVKFVNKQKHLQNADWIFAHFLTDSGYIGAKIKDQLRAKLAVIALGDDVHAWPEKDPSLKRHFPLIFQKADLVLANSTNLGIDTQKWMEPGNMRKVITVYNGVNHNKFRPALSGAEKTSIKEKHNLDDDTKYIVCIATRVLLKGWIELFNAIKILGDKLDGWNLIVISPPRDVHDALDLEAIGKSMGIEDKLFHFREALPSDKIAEILRASDIFILPSYNEGMSNALLEAMASGLPCIATDVGGHNEVIESEDEGILIPARSVAALVDAIAKMVDSEELRVAMGIMARKKMMELGDYIYNAQKLLGLFNS